MFAFTFEDERFGRSRNTISFIKIEGAKTKEILNNAFEIRVEFTKAGIEKMKGRTTLRGADRRGYTPA